MSTATIASRRIQLAGLFAFFTLVLAIYFFATPQGRAWAQDIFHFFTQSRSNIEVWPTKTPVALNPATVPIQIEGVERELESSSGEQVEIRLPTKLPPGFKIAKVDFADNRGQVHVEFSFYDPETGRDAHTVGLDLYAQPADELAGKIWGPQGEVETVAVGEITGEFVRGVWWKDRGTGGVSFYMHVTPEEAADLQWTTDVDYIRLRWQLGDLTYWLVARGSEPGVPGFVGKNGLVTIAESLKLVMSSVGTWPEAETFEPQVDISDIRMEVFTMDHSAIEAEAGFDVRTPTVMPANYTFTGGGVIDMAHSTYLQFSCVDGNTEWAFTLEQLKRSEEEFLKDIKYYQPQVGAGGKVEEVSINGVPGEYVQGTWVPKLNSSGNMVEVWESSGNWHSLYWYQDGMLFRIGTSRSMTDKNYAGACLLDKESLVAFAESLK